MIFLKLTYTPFVRGIFLLVPAVLLILGVQSLYIYFTDTTPVEVSIEQLISNPPRAKWLRVTGGRINLIDAVASGEGFNKTIDRLYIPIQPEGKEDAAVSVLLLSTNPELINLSRQIHALEGAKDGDAEEMKLVMENVRVIIQKRPFEGLIQSGFSKDDRMTFQVSKALPNLVKEPIIIEEGKEPRIVEGLLLLLVALVVTVGILSLPSARPSTPPPLPPPLPPTPPRLPQNA